MREGHNAALILSALAATSGVHVPVVGGDVTATRLGGQPTEWSAMGRWSYNPAVGAPYPDNGQLGFDYDVIISGTTVTLDRAITIDNMDLLGVIELEGFALTLQNNLSTSFGTFQNGTFSADRVTATSNVTFQSTQASVNRLTLSVNANALLSGGSQLAVMEQISFTGDGDLDASAAPGTGYTLVGAGEIIKTGGTGTSEIRAPLTATDLTLRSISPTSSEIRFLNVPQSWNSLDIEVLQQIDFSSPLTIGDMHVKGIDNGQVLINSDVVLSGVLTTEHESMQFLFGDVLIISTLQGVGSLSGGTLRPDTDGRILLDDGATLAKTAPVMLDGLLDWRNGIIGPGTLTIVADQGFGNLNNFSADGPCIVRGTIMNDGQIFAVRTITLEDGGQIITGADGVHVVRGDIQIADGTLAPTTLVRSEGKVEVRGFLGGSSFEIDAPFVATNMIDLTERGSLFLSDSVTLEDVTIRRDPEEAEGVLGILPDADVVGVGEFNLRGTISLESVQGTDIPVFSIGRGDVVLDGTITTTQVGRGRARILAVAPPTPSLSGGTLNLAGQDASFVHEGGTVGLVSEVKNDGAYLFSEGTIGDAGVLNRGLIDVSDGTSPKTINKLTNESAVTQFMGTSVTISSPGVTNTGLWTLEGMTQLNPDPVLSGTFINAADGEIEAISTSGNVFNCSVNNLGTVTADGGTIRFNGFFVQFNSSTGELTGGRYVVRNGGAIEFFDGSLLDVKRLGTTATAELVNALQNGVSPFEALEELGGALRVSGNTTIDLRNNANGGALEIDPGGDLFDGESILLGAGPRGPGSRLIATSITNRGRTTTLGTGVIEATAGITLLDGGTLAGELGTYLTPLVDNTSGVLSPGDATALDTTSQVTIDGDYTQGALGTLRIELGGSNPTQVDTLAVTGTAALDGVLDLALADGFPPSIGEQFAVLSASSITGTFAGITGEPGFTVLYSADEVRIVYDGTCPADITGDGILNNADINAFVAAFIGQQPAADQNADGFWNSTDINLFVQSFLAGCG